MIGIATIIIEDAKGDRSQVRYYFNSIEFGNVTNFIDDLEGYFNQVALRIDPLIGGQIVDISITLSMGVPNGLKTAPVATSDVEEKARFTFRDAGGARYQHEIPTFDHGLFPPGATVVMPDDVTAINYLTRLLIAPTDAPDWPSEYGGITDNRGVALTIDEPVEKRFRRR